MTDFQAVQRAEAMHELIRTRHWQVYADHLAGLVHDAINHVGSCSPAELPEARARWKALEQALHIPQKLINQAQRAHKETA